MIIFFISIFLLSTLEKAPLSPRPLIPHPARPRRCSDVPPLPQHSFNSNPTRPIYKEIRERGRERERERERERRASYVRRRTRYHPPAVAQQSLSLSLLPRHTSALARTSPTYTGRSCTRIRVSRIWASRGGGWVGGGGGNEVLLLSRARSRLGALGAQTRLGGILIVDPLFSF